VSVVNPVRIKRYAESQLRRNKTDKLDVLQRVIGLEAMRESIALHGVGEQRVRRLPALLTLLVCIGMNLLTTSSLTFVLVRLVRGTRLLCDVGLDELPSKAAITQARYRLGAKPLETLFKASYRPLAGPDTRGAFAFGPRLMALDGSVEEVADTPANAAYFGRHRADRGEAAFPQLQAVYLCQLLPTESR
jgi:hypothetical protein